VLPNPVFSSFLLQESVQGPQGKYMHLTHVHDDLLLLHIMFARGNHKHEGTFLITFHSDAYSQDTCSSLLTLSCCAFTCLLSLSLHDCTHVGGAYTSYMFLQSFNVLLIVSLLEALMYVVINYKKRGD
jgi:hypothetical protein